MGVSKVSKAKVAFNVIRIPVPFDRSHTISIAAIVCIVHRFRFPALELGHLQLMLIFCYKLMFDLIPVPFTDLFQFCCNLNTQVTNVSCTSPKCLKCSSKFFSHRILNVRLRNGLPPSNDFGSLSAFKRTIKLAVKLCPRSYLSVLNRIHVLMSYVFHIIFVFIFVLFLLSLCVMLGLEVCVN